MKARVVPLAVLTGRAVGRSPLVPTISGAYGGATRSAALTVAPPSALSSVSVNPTSVTGETSSQGTVTLTSAAPAGGIAVSLSSSDASVATVPASVSVAQGGTSATFAIPTGAVAASTPVRSRRAPRG